MKLAPAYLVADRAANKGWLTASVAPMGPAYQAQMRQALAGGWIDVYENPGKRSGAYSAPVYGVHPYMLLNYNETLDAVSGHFRLYQLAHGHRFSTDDVLVAWYATENSPQANRILDLGSGIGSVALMVAFYSMSYMHGEPRYGWYFGALSLFVTAMLMLVLSGNLLQLYVAWEGVGLASFLLIGFYWERQSAAEAAKKAIKLMAQTATIVTSFDRLRNGKDVVPGDPKLSE